MDFISGQTFDFFRLSGNSASWNEVLIILVRYGGDIGSRLQSHRGLI